MADGADAPRVPRRTQVLAVNLATAVVLVAIAIALPPWRPWVALVAIVAPVGEIIRWRRARRSGETSWEPLLPSRSSGS